MMNRGTKICVAAAMLAPIQYSNTRQNSLRDESICLAILSRDYESGKVFQPITDGIFLKADDKSAHI